MQAVDTSDAPAAPARDVRRRRSTHVARALLGAALVVAGALYGVQAGALAAVVVPEPVDADLLVQADWPLSPLGTLAPGRPAHWVVDTWVVGTAEAEFTLELRKDGDLMTMTEGATTTVERCATAWVGLPDDPACESGWGDVAAVVPTDDYDAWSPVWMLSTKRAYEPVHLLVTIALDESPDTTNNPDLMGLTGNIALGVTATATTPLPDDEKPDAPPTPGSGSGDDVGLAPAPPASAPGGPSLPVTGADVLGLLLSAAAIASGGVLILGARRRVEDR
ncbi:hypothetical protein ATL42_1160 [Sanguibacter antarcticus]|uniref:Uncharacterized protein n=2 Tax=Sanguibacter antarcticus TaxID=372484 RepID=A0A2A9E4Y4_9MICO|nr:hypothetical protein ATL42_1160 [Sanguibacter antarcticus]